MAKGWEPHELHTAQLADPDLVLIMTEKEEGKPQPEWQDISQETK